MALQTVAKTLVGATVMHANWYRQTTEPHGLAGSRVNKDIDSFYYKPVVFDQLYEVCI